MSDAESMHRTKRDTYNDAYTDTHGSDRRKQDQGSRGARTTCGRPPPSNLLVCACPREGIEKRRINAGKERKCERWPGELRVSERRERDGRESTIFS